VIRVLVAFFSQAGHRISPRGIGMPQDEHVAGGVAGAGAAAGSLSEGTA